MAERGTRCTHRKGARRKLSAYGCARRISTRRAGHAGRGETRERGRVTCLLVSGGALWLFGRSAYHVGASNVLFGYFGYLVARGWYERSVTALLVALLTLGLYGGMVWGVLPRRSYISWEGHVFGLLAGMRVAQLATSRPVFCLSSQSSGA